MPPATWNGLDLIEIIGEGRFGTVYRAFDRSLDREIAVKLLHAREAPDVEGERVVAEGRLAAKVRHANVVTIYGAGHVDGRTGIWMELVRGRTLEAVLSAEGPRPAEAIRHIAIQLGRALTAVHAAGLVHRDIKTTNVMRESDDRVVLGDFGTGGEYDHDVGGRSGLVGTPPYLAPEIFLGQPATPQSDRYSLGVLLFRLATGTFPVSGKSIGALRAAHARGNVTSVRASRRDLPRSLARAIDRLLDPDPRRRHQSAREVEAALKAPARRPLLIAAALAAIVSTGVLVSLWPGRASPGGGFRLEHIDPEFQKGYVIYAASVDGRHFPCRLRGANVVALCDLERRSMTTIRAPVKPPFGAQDGQLSPNGRLIAYPWRDDRSSQAIYVTGVDGSATRKLFEAQAVWVNGWTQDGRSVIVHDNSPGGAPRLISVPIDGGPPTVLWQLTAGDSNAVISPDLRSIAIARPVGGMGGEIDLHGFDVATGETRWRIVLQGNQVTPVWLPSGRSIAFISDHLGASSVMSASIGSKGLASAPVVHHTIGRGQLTLRGRGAGGELYAWMRPPTRDSSMATIDMPTGASSEVQMLEARSLEDTMGADWSPDARQVAYLRGKAGAPGAPAHLVIRSVDDGRERTIPLPGFLQNTGPRVRWSPDGRLIAATFAVSTGPSSVRGVLGLVNVSLERIELIANAGDVRTPSWDHSTGDLLYVSDGVVERHTPASGAAVAQHLPQPQGLTISRDAGAALSSAGTLAVAADGGACRIRLVEQSGRFTDIGFESGRCSALTWTPDGARLLVGISGPTAELWTFDPLHGTRARVSLDASWFYDLSINRDGRLLYTDGNRLPSLWRITGLPR